MKFYGIFAIALAFGSRLSNAFVHKNHALGASRLLSIKGGANNLPSNEELKPFYALGISIINIFHLL